MTLRVVVDTNVFVGALVGREGHNRGVIRTCLQERALPMMGQTLFLEYEDVLGRKDLFRNSPLSLLEREHLLDAFLSVCEWVQVYYLWRPNLADEADNHILELAIAGNASAIVTNNLADFRHAELRFPEIQVVTPKQFLEKLT